MSHVLIVDDNEENLYMLGSLLRGSGYTVSEARNGKDALSAARQAAPDIVISDLLMPVMDGYTLLREWRADDRLSAIPFIVYTATYTEPKDERLAIAMGANEFIVKPAEPEVLMERIESVLERQAAGTLTAAMQPAPDDRSLLREYNEVLIRKLERKMAQLEEANRTLREDIVLRKQVEEALRKLSAAVEQSPVSVVIADLHGKIEYVNPLFTQLTGYTLHEQSGRDPWTVLSGGSDAGNWQVLQKIIADGGQWHGESPAKRKDGRVYWQRSTISPIRDASNTITHYLAIQEDITAHRNLEAQYLQSQKMEAIGRLAGGIAHDFNNMLAVILGYIDAVLLDMKPADPLYADLDQVRSAANRSADLTRQLLAFSRQQTIAPVVLDVNAQVKSIETLLQRVIGEDIRIRYTLEPKLWPVEMDPSQFDQILTNLAVNARDAMPGGGTLSIETSNVQLDEPVDPKRADFEPGDFVLLAISDTGCGMGPDMMGRLFEPFFTTKAPGKGTGLGLATLYGIVKQNGGHVNVYSEPDQGTTFRIYLPRCKGKAKRAAAAPQSSGDQRGTETILLVEDDKMVRSLAKRILERFGYTTLEAATPDEAIALCESHPGDIHLLLSDVVMPAMNGKELKERLSALRPSLKTLYMSGYTADVIANRGVLDKDTHFIAKPFSTAEIGKKVREVLDAAR